MAKDHYISVKELPHSIKQVLDKVGYGRTDIGVRAGETYSPACSSSDGCQSFCAVVNMKIGCSEIHWGSWGGPNMFNPGNSVDMDRNVYQIPEDGAVVQGSRGGSRPVYATVTVNPVNLAKLIPAIPDMDIRVRAAVTLVKCRKGGYRAEEFRNWGLGEYGWQNEWIQLAKKLGLVKINRAGAVSVTTDGRNAGWEWDHQARRAMEEAGYKTSLY